MKEITLTTPLSELLTSVESSAIEPNQPKSTPSKGKGANKGKRETTAKIEAEVKACDELTKQSLVISRGVEYSLERDGGSVVIKPGIKVRSFFGANIQHQLDKTKYPEATTIDNILTSSSRVLQGILEQDKQEQNKQQSTENKRLFLLQTILNYYRGKTINCLFATTDSETPAGSEAFALYDGEVDAITLRVDGASQAKSKGEIFERNSNTMIAAAMAHELLHKFNHDEEGARKIIDKYTNQLLKGTDLRDFNAVKTRLEDLVKNFASIIYSPIMSDKYKTDFLKELANLQNSEKAIELFKKKIMGEIIPNIVTFAYSMNNNDIVLLLSISVASDNPLLKCTDHRVLEGFVNDVELIRNNPAPTKRNDPLNRFFNQLPQIQKTIEKGGIASEKHLNEISIKVEAIKRDVLTLGDFFREYNDNLARYIDVSILNDITTAVINNFDRNLDNAEMLVNNQFKKVWSSTNSLPRIMESEFKNNSEAKAAYNYLNQKAKEQLKIKEESSQQSSTGLKRLVKEEKYLDLTSLKINEEKQQTKKLKLEDESNKSSSSPGAYINLSASTSGTSQAATQGAIGAGQEETKWYDETQIEQYLKIFVPQEVNICYAENRLNALRIAMNTVKNDNNAAIVFFNVHAVTKSMDTDTNHWVGLHIAKQQNDNNNNNTQQHKIIYIDPMGHGINPEVAKTILGIENDENNEQVKQRISEIKQPLADPNHLVVSVGGDITSARGIGIQFTAPGIHKDAKEFPIEIGGNQHDCGPFLIYLLACVGNGVTIGVENISEETSGNLGQMLRSSLKKGEEFNTIHANVQNILNALNTDENLKKDEKEILSQNAGENYNLKDNLALTNNAVKVMKIAFTAKAQANKDIAEVLYNDKRTWGLKVSSHGRKAKVELMPESDHNTDHDKNVDSLITAIENGTIKQNTVIALERKQYGDNLGMPDVIMLADMMKHNNMNPTHQIKIPDEIKASPIYKDAQLYNVARDRGIKVIGVEGKDLPEFSKDSPEYNKSRENHMASEMAKMLKQGYNVIMPVGSNHTGSIQSQLEKQGISVKVMAGNNKKMVGKPSVHWASQISIVDKQGKTPHASGVKQSRSDVIQPVL